MCFSPARAHICSQSHLFHWTRVSHTAPSPPTFLSLFCLCLLISMCVHVGIKTTEQLKVKQWQSATAEISSCKTSTKTAIFNCPCDVTTRNWSTWESQTRRHNKGQLKKQMKKPNLSAHLWAPQMLPVSARGCRTGWNTAALALSREQTPSGGRKAQSVTTALEILEHKTKIWEGPVWDFSQYNNVWLFLSDCLCFLTLWTTF